MIRFHFPQPFRTSFILVLFTALLFLPGGHVSSAQENPAGAPLDENQILRHLNNVITWYRNSRTQVQPVGLPSDAIYQANANRIAAEVVTHAFESAQSAVALLPSENAQSSANAARQNLLKLLSDTANHNAQLKKQIDQLNSQIASVPRRSVSALTDHRDRLQGELDLGTSMVGTLNQLVNVSEQKAQKSGANGQSNQPNSNGLQASITQLKSSLPELFDAKGQPTTAASTAQNANSSSGLISQLHQLYEQSMSLHQIDTLVQETNQLQDLVNKMRTPLRTQLRATVDQGREMSATADNAQPGQPAPTKQDFDALASKFNQISAVEVPLSQEALSLNEANANLADWRNSIAHEYRVILFSVLLRVGIILAALGFLFLVSDLWKRMSFKYIADPRRRRQILIVRRFVIGFLMGLVFILGFVSEFSALATFAGFITAGLAVGLQTILLSVAAYFFLIGRYGLRVGDRISIAGVTGDVIEIGIVRFYLMELASTGIDLQPTGRVVAFSNAVLFQATSPMFRQLPGTEYTWHEIVVTLNPSANYQTVEQSMMQVVQDIYARYRPTLQQQQRVIEQRFEVPLTPLTPRAQLQLAANGLEAVVRYPVSLRENIEVDDEISRRLVELMAKNEELKAAISGLPKIRAAIVA